ncbi:MAG: outer membrane protein assembly factor BamE [Deltaproteobacteria bacterium]|nr:outer membrane protein assembly factor BamE [Deltaproteobacteria bacterium]
MKPPNNLNIALILFLLAVALLASGCVTIGHEFPVDAVSSITIDQTTQKEIHRIFGSPWRTGIEDGMKTWSYGYYRYAGSENAMMKDLVIRFDEKGFVNSYTFNTTEEKADGKPPNK